MLLSSGKTITDETMRDIADNWVREAMGPGAEHVADVSQEESIAYGSFDSVRYEEEDCEYITSVLYEVVLTVVNELREAYGKIYEKHLATRTF